MARTEVSCCGEAAWLPPPVMTRFAPKGSTRSGQPGMPAGSCVNRPALIVYAGLLVSTHDPAGISLSAWAAGLIQACSLVSAANWKTPRAPISIAATRPAATTGTI